MEETVSDQGVAECVCSILSPVSFVLHALLKLDYMMSHYTWTC